jgi:hypothetical protein
MELEYLSITSGSRPMPSSLSKMDRVSRPFLATHRVSHLTPTFPFPSMTFFFSPAVPLPFLSRCLVVIYSIVVIMHSSGPN